MTSKKGNKLLYQLLTERFGQIQRKNARISLRAFAAQLGISPSSLSAFLGKKRTLSSKNVNRILEKAKDWGIQHEDLEKILSNKASPVECDEQDIREYISNGYHSVIRFLVATNGFQPDTSWITKRTGLPGSQIEEILARLLRMKLIQRTADNQLVPQEINLHLSGSKYPEEVFKSKKMSLKFASKYLERNPVNTEDAYISHITFTFDPKRLKEFKAKMIEVMRSLAEEAEAAEPEEVYQLSLQLTPITKPQSS